MGRPPQKIESAIADKTIEEQLADAKGERTTLRGRQVKHDALSIQDEARLKTIDALIESLEKNLATESQRKAAEKAARQARKEHG